jgi:Flp pilus assembly protein TadD
VLALISYLVIRCRSERVILGGWLWFLGTLVPVIGLVPVGYQSMADRYTYFPMIGLSISVVWSFELLRRGRGGNATPWVVGFAACIGLAGTSWAHLPVWENSGSLYRQTLSVTEGNQIIHNNMGSWHFDEEEFEASIRQYRAALVIDPKYSECRQNLIFALQAAGRNREAIEEVRVYADSNPAEHALVFELGRLQEHYGEATDALKSYERFLQLEPDDAEGWNGLGRVHRSLGQQENAGNSFRRAAELDRDLREAHWNLAAHLVETGNAAEAGEVLEAFLMEHVFDQETRQMLARLKESGAE